MPVLAYDVPHAASLHPLTLPGGSSVASGELMLPRRVAVESPGERTESWTLSKDNAKLRRTFLSVPFWCCFGFAQSPFACLDSFRIFRACAETRHGDSVHSPVPPIIPFPVSPPIPILCFTHFTFARAWSFGTVPWRSCDVFRMSIYLSDDSIAFRRGSNPHEPFLSWTHEVFLLPLLGSCLLARSRSHPRLWVRAFFSPSEFEHGEWFLFRFFSFSHLCGHAFEPSVHATPSATRSGPLARRPLGASFDGTSGRGHQRRAHPRRLEGFDAPLQRSCAFRHGRCWTRWPPMEDVGGLPSPSPRKTGQRPSVFAVPGRSTEGKGGAKARPDSGIRRRMGLAGRKHGKGDGRVASFDGVESDRDTDEDPMAIGATRTPFPFPPSGSLSLPSILSLLFPFCSLSLLFLFPFCRSHFPN